MVTFVVGPRRWRARQLFDMLVKSYQAWNTYGIKLTVWYLLNGLCGERIILEHFILSDEGGRRFRLRTLSVVCHDCCFSRRCLTQRRPWSHARVLGQPSLELDKIRLDDRIGTRIDCCISWRITPSLPVPS